MPGVHQIQRPVRSRHPSWIWCLTLLGVVGCVRLEHTSPLAAGPAKLPHPRIEAPSPTPLPAPPRRYREPAPPPRELEAEQVVREEDFEFAVEAMRLEGTLSWPNRLDGRALPGVVIVHGSGPMTRDGTMSGQLGARFGFRLQVYEDLARALSDRGLAVLRYDKRGSVTPRWSGSAATERDAGPSTTMQYAIDALAAMRALAQHPLVDPHRLFFVGHSQGGQLVPWLLWQMPSVRGGVLLTTPHGTVDELLHAQAEALPALMLEAGYSPLQAWWQGRVLERAATSVAHLAPGRLEGDTLGTDNHLWYSWQLMSRSAPWMAARLDRPLLVVAGGQDHNVSEADFLGWQRTLTGARRARHRFCEIECMTHALNCLEESTVDPSRHPTAALAEGLAAVVTAYVDAMVGAGADPGQGCAPSDDGPIGQEH